MHHHLRNSLYVGVCTLVSTRFYEVFLAELNV